MPRVLSLHGDYGISGVSTWGARMARRTHDHDIEWHLGVVGASPDEAARWAAAHDAPADRVHAFAHGAAALTRVCDRLEIDVVVPNDAEIDDGPLPRPAVAVCHSDDIGWRARIERLADGCDGFVAVSPHLLPLMHDAFTRDQPTWVQPCGVEVPAGEPPAMPEGARLRLAWVGRFDRTEKRVHDVVPLVEQLAGAGVDVVLHAVGDGPARDEIEPAALRLGDRMTVGAPCPPSCVRSLLAASHALVMTSATDGWPIVAMEAMSLGRPVLATMGCGGAADAIARHRAGVVVDIGDMTTMAQHVERLARDRAELEALGRNALAAVRAECDADVMVGHWKQIVREVIAGPRRAGAVGQVGPTPVERLMALAVARSGGGRVALYGGGAHTARVASVIADHDAVVCVVDDEPSREAIGSKPVVTPDVAASMGIDAIVCSSDAWEDRLVERAAGWAPGVPIVRLYERGKAWRTLRDAFGL